MLAHIFVPLGEKKKKIVERESRESEEWLFSYDERGAEDEDMTWVIFTPLYRDESSDAF